MSDTDTQIQDGSSQNSTDNKDAIIADLQSQLEKMANKTRELLEETKKAKQRAREESEQKERAKMEKAQKEGDFEKLFKSSEKERELLKSQLTELHNKVSSEKIRSEAMKIASELADGENVELLSHFVQSRLKYSEDGLKVTDESGNLTVSSIDDLKREYSSSSKYKSLLRGNRASGGSAQGSGDSVTSAKQTDRASFLSMDPAKQASFIKSGGTVTDTN